MSEAVEKGFDNMTIADLQVLSWMAEQEGDSYLPH